MITQTYHPRRCCRRRGPGRGQLVLLAVLGVLILAVVGVLASRGLPGEDIPVPDYVEENVSTKVVKIIQSYTGVVNKMVWRKF